MEDLSGPGSNILDGLSKIVLYSVYNMLQQIPLMTLQTQVVTASTFLFQVPFLGSFAGNA